MAPEQVNPVEEILGYRVSIESPEEIARTVCANLDGSRDPLWLACLNPHSWVVARSQPNFANALQSADWLIPDGIGVVIASRLNMGRIRRRMTGSEIFEILMQAFDERGAVRVMFLGSDVVTLLKLQARAVREFPRVQIVGLYAPPFIDKFSDEQMREMCLEVNKCRPDVLWVGLTSPKQDLLIASTREFMQVPFAAGIGAVFDFYSGRKSRPAALWQSLGLEWLVRLLQEFRRLWRRTFISAPIFFFALVRWRISRYMQARKTDDDSQLGEQ